jgi:hypothetical protein
LLALTLAPAMDAQKSSTLDDPLAGDFRIINSRFLQSCNIGTAIDQIARHANVRVGVENTTDCWLSPRSLSAGDDAEVLSGMSARQAFDHVIELMPAYQWKDMDGVIVVRPKAACDNPTNVLNLPTASVNVANAHVHRVLHDILHATTPSLFYPHTDLVLSSAPHRSSRSIDEPVSVAFRGGTFLDALNAVVRSYEGEWELGYLGGATIMLRTLVFAGGTTTSPVALPASR